MTASLLQLTVSRLSSPSSQAASTRQLQTEAEVIATAKSYLSECPSDAYVVVSQPSVSQADYSNANAVPHLRQMMAAKATQTKVSIAEVVGNLEADDLQSYLQSQCGAGILTVDASSKLPSMRSVS